jgi:hypothetical protein
MCQIIKLASWKLISESFPRKRNEKEEDIEATV